MLQARNVFMLIISIVSGVLIYKLAWAFLFTLPSRGAGWYASGDTELSSLYGLLLTGGLIGYIYLVAKFKTKGSASTIISLSTFMAAFFSSFVISQI
ncbi:hypothetical protein PaecuDRAFT_1745 [Paenibacillus curdlanolyticus YK9]|uniref:Uncharacterized protein n=1 Tax=Paenibacillus curdlanolyticus YK9 TaxID=717606 RepID=E0I7Z4_9BACL|nr:hypothetical protein [Paenibacillus curdlanolyticus]EFM11299.1 hypothetical protein PaecuDRAFT_1745 [Paenibacillus curdlanolyticus YK9]